MDAAPPPIKAVMPARTAAEELQDYCDLFGHPKATIWDRYNAGDRRALVHKLKIIYGISEAVATVAADDVGCCGDGANPNVSGSRVIVCCWHMNKPDVHTLQAGDMDTDNAMYSRVFDRDSNDDITHLVCHKRFKTVA